MKQIFEDISLGNFLQYASIAKYLRVSAEILSMLCLYIVNGTMKLLISQISNPYSSRAVYMLQIGSLKITKISLT